MKDKTRSTCPACGTEITDFLRLLIDDAIAAGRHDGKLKIVENGRNLFTKEPIMVCSLCCLAQCLCSHNGNVRRFTNLKCPVHGDPDSDIIIKKLLDKSQLGHKKRAKTYRKSGSSCT